MVSSSSSPLADFPPGAAITTVASSPTTKRWTGSTWPPMMIVAWIVIAWVIEEWLVIENMAWGADGDDDGGARWVARALALLLAGTVTAALWMTHFLDPGVIPPNKEVDADVSWFLALNRPRANVFSTTRGRGRGEGGGGDGRSGFSAGTGDDDDDDDDKGSRMVTRFSKDYKGQPIKSVFPEGLLDPEDPEGPLLKGGIMVGVLIGERREKSIFKKNV